MNFKSISAMFVLLTTALLHGCAVVPTGGVVVSSSGSFHYPSYYPGSYPYGYGSTRDPRIQTREDEHGLVSFSVSQSGLTEPEVNWLLRRVDELKVRCANGGEMKKYEIRSVERANPYSVRPKRGDTTVRIEYVCNRGGGNYRTPSAREPATPAPPPSQVPSALRSKFLLPT